MTYFEKGSHVLLPFLSCFVSWSKTTAPLIFAGVGEKGRAGRRLGWEVGGQRLDVADSGDKDLKGGPSGLRDRAGTTPF